MNFEVGRYGKCALLLIWQYLSTQFVIPQDKCAQFNRAHFQLLAHSPTRRSFLNTIQRMFHSKCHFFNSVPFKHFEAFRSPPSLVVARKNGFCLSLNVTRRAPKRCQFFTFPEERFCSYWLPESLLPAPGSSIFQKKPVGPFVFPVPLSYANCSSGSHLFLEEPWPFIFSPWLRIPINF